MKKTFIFIMMTLIITVSGCKKEKSKSLNYNDSDPLSIVLRETRQVNATSEYDITYTTSNDKVVSILNAGNIYGKNVGQAKITLSNSYESKTVDVNVDLFREPSLDFGCTPKAIKSQFGTPYNAGYNAEGYLVYVYSGNEGYSYACGEMDFFFESGRYIEADVYIRKNLDNLLNNYLNESFTLTDTIKVYNPNISDSTDALIYRYHEDMNIICGRYPSGNEWQETFLFYTSLDEKGTNRLIRKPLRNP